MKKALLFGMIAVTCGALSGCGGSMDSEADEASDATETLRVAVPAEKLANGVSVEVLQDSEGVGFLSLTGEAEVIATKDFERLSPAQQYTALTGKAAPSILVDENAVSTRETSAAQSYAGFCPTGSQDWGSCYLGVTANHTEDVWTGGTVNFKVCVQGKVTGELRVWKLFGGWNTLVARDLSNVCWTVTSNPSVVRHYRNNVTNVNVGDKYDVAFWGNF